MIKTLGELAQSDVFDSRDVIDRIEDLESSVTQWDGEDLTLPCLTCGESYQNHVTDESGDMALVWCPTSDEDERVELDQLRAFAKEAEGYCADWKYGESFIADSYFEDYAEQLADDIGVVNSDRSYGSGTPWPLMHIDWQAAAADLQQDYTSVELLGRTFWTR